MILLPEGVLRLGDRVHAPWAQLPRSSGPQLYSHRQQALRACALEPYEQGYHFLAVGPWAWANASGPQLPLLHNEADNRPRFTGLQGGSQEGAWQTGPLSPLTAHPLAHLRVQGAPSPPLRRGPCQEPLSPHPGPGPLFLLGFCNPWAHS